MRGALTGTRIRERRMMAGLRQAELAAAVGISPSYLNLIEHNRRRIGGKLLVDIARRLDVEASALAEGAEVALLQGLREAAAGHEAALADLPRIEEFAGRFPGWAQLVVDQGRRLAELERTVELLSDRMAHDPSLSASLHEVLSVVTAIRSTAAILAETKDIDPGWQARFHRNIHDDSRRLAEGTKALVTYLDESTDAPDRQGTPQEEVEAFLKARGYHFPELEAGRADIGALIASAAELSSAPARELARRFLERYAHDAASLPLEAFAAAVSETGPEPGHLAHRFGVDPLMVFRRLASLPEARMGTPAGLVLCDGSGTLTFRKPLAGFALPRFGAACPLWPLYRALTHPMDRLRVVVEQASRPPQRFLTYALCQPVGVQGFSGPQVVEAAMLILPAPRGAEDAEATPIGTSCRVCPRRDCAARREPSILADGF
ncbi:MAG: transcriptional regulator [Confluentimicrobium sp.]|uniref:helix-turn-helix transcriptional regulator n=1 Tax=Actibacterium sp. TaxID=1872125 RepID=UPI000C4C461E|nr:helix-turn-helix transcriptional regulator [Actibacterium sp.]MBC55997.1 transcriptional regulator [Actibacterium sp.]